MPIFDYYCKGCGFSEDDVFVHDPDKVILCKMCETPMDKRPPNFSFRMTPGAISKFKRKYGKRVPDSYKTTGGANIYGVPKKNT